MSLLDSHQRGVSRSSLRDLRQLAHTVVHRTVPHLSLSLRRETRNPSLESQCPEDFHMYRSRHMTALTVFALALSLTFAVSVGTSPAKKATPKLFKSTTYKPLGCGREPEPPCVKGKTSSVRNKLSSLTFLVRPISFD